MLCLIGPTACGKSALAMALAADNPKIEIISMDSALVYQGMDIGTAKPSPAEQRKVRHHLIDLIDPAESYSAARFVADAQAACEDIRHRGGLPVMVGGTMLYFKAYQEGLDQLPSVPTAIRSAIEKEASDHGWPAMHERLAQIDPATASRLKPTDAQRISRALELFEFTGQPMSVLIAQSAPRQVPGAGQREPLQVVALVPEDRAALHSRIASRFKAMLAEGFLNEVKGLQARGDLHPDLPSMRCVGYRQAWEYLSGQTTETEFIEAGIAATRQLAKRQLTWLRSFHNMTAIDPLTTDLSQQKKICLNLIT